jgi:hypothetical protein
VLLDECFPRALRRDLPGHDVRTIAEMGWAGVKNGELLRLAAKDFDLLLTVDRNLEYQQNFAGVSLAVVVADAKKQRHCCTSPFDAGGACGAGRSRARQSDPHWWVKPGN